LVTVVCIGAVGCYKTPVMPPQGWVFSQYKAPLSADLQGVKADPAPKVGKAEVQNILGLVAVGDCSLEAAAKSENISTVQYADYEYFNVLGVYQRFTLFVHGN
jgi:hypothetical protein